MEAPIARDRADARPGVVCRPPATMWAKRHPKKRSLTTTSVASDHEAPVNSARPPPASTAGTRVESTAASTSAASAGDSPAASATLAATSRPAAASIVLVPPSVATETRAEWRSPSSAVATASPV